MSNSEIYPRTETYYEKLGRLAKLTQFEKDENGVLSLTKRDPKVPEGQEDPVLKTFQKEYKAPADFHAPKSPVMEKGARPARNETEKKLFAWRDRMNGIGQNIMPLVQTKEIKLLDGLSFTEYIPQLTDLNQPLPAVIYYHGGGFIGGSVYLTQNFSYLLAQRAHARVFALDFRYAPEYSYENTTKETYDALKYLHDHAAELGVDPARITIYGESTGANIAAATIYLDRDTHFAKQQILCYPLVTIDDKQLAELVPQGAGSGAVGASGDFTTLIKTIGTAYTHGQIDKRNELVSPINYSEKTMKQLPRTIIMTDEFDPLHNQGYQFAKKLTEGGVDVHYMYYPGMTHAFLNNVGLYAQAEDFANEVTAWMLGQN
ncbi:hypothetical protein IV38_GL000985 [Lactobacillus selangorensis]|uniref:Alpha/beta hydrolase fold-3 domain-containing protein n=1 Tax=Lactobacillus selangorensis TaxID=81857 RepID=A0A0R2G6M4_9LACO|nr:alpha/beta hydrolase [Lactobacillus selangorensis]KRN28780.1 hypothetical protein IV38_GL000985 [Lactobacillus selangorensis]KRN32810.1 hypothetical protein IV40_GL000868 [Lactobacillus selangorensis]